MLLDFNNLKINRPTQTAEFGIERESLRVTSDGKLAQTIHPFAGDQHLDRDFCENQVEMIGDVFNDPADLIRQLGQFLDNLNEELTKNNEEHLQYQCPDKRFYYLTQKLICPNMKSTTLVDLYNCVAGKGGEEIMLDDDTIVSARKCIDEMIRLGS